ncbi:hypothetical protein, partial [Faecalibaculum rodentium]|uniref:hypothetical protein n=2 Tax=Faecalibaculum rodentium TaxID=1702221 RepID=UPI00256F084E
RNNWLQLSFTELRSLSSKFVWISLFDRTFTAVPSHRVKVISVYVTCLEINFLHRILSLAKGAAAQNSCLAP